MRSLETKEPDAGTSGSQGKGNAGRNSKGHNTANGTNRQANWGHRNPLARWAHRAFESALKRGLVEREPCEECGEAQTEFHHYPDRYHEPLTGRHLCRSCHRTEHARLRKAGAA